MTDDQLTDEQIEEMRERCDSRDIEYLDDQQTLMIYEAPGTYDSDEMYHPANSATQETSRHIATFDPPTVRKLLDAAEERNRLKVHAETLESQQVEDAETISELQKRVDQLEAALEKGQRNCDAVYDEMQRDLDEQREATIDAKVERDEARLERERFRDSLEEIRNLPEDPDISGATAAWSEAIEIVRDALEGEDDE